LPDAFLRRCVFHFIDFPTPDLMQRIVDVHHPGLGDALAKQSMEIFYEIRNMRRLRKRPSTSELIDWIAVLKAAGVKDLKLDSSLPYLGTLLKKEQDLAAFADQIAGGPRYRS
ncbi:MAG: MoxR family ATPase, partial [Myxococcales bacterium]|nr:MoxR family ATPase [Myxococcales bacterium]